MDKGCKTSCLRCSHKCRVFYRGCVGVVVTMAVLCGLGMLAWKTTKGFTIQGIASHRPFDPAWQTRALMPQEREEVDGALSQKYHYFGRGGQCYVFASEDDRYVIKFFKQTTYTIPLWHHFIPIPCLFDRYKAKKSWKREDKLIRDFLSYKIAFEELPEMTGTVLIHLNQTQDLKKTLTIADRLKIEHKLDLDQFDFILQRKAQLISPAIVELIEAHQIDQAKQMIDQIAELVVARCKQGLEDRDLEVRTNCGVLNGRVIKIDVGRFDRDETMKTAPVCLVELQKVMNPFKGWLQPINAEVSEYCDAAVGKAMDHGFGEG